MRKAAIITGIILALLGGYLLLFRSHVLRVSWPGETHAISIDWGVISYSICNKKYDARRKPRSMKEREREKGAESYSETSYLGLYPFAFPVSEKKFE